VTSIALFPHKCIPVPSLSLEASCYSHQAIRLASVYMSVSLPSSPHRYVSSFVPTQIYLFLRPHTDISLPSSPHRYISLSRRPAVPPCLCQQLLLTSPCLTSKPTFFSCIPHSRFSNTCRQQASKREQLDHQSQPGQGDSLSKIISV
jgi:hypothetical protein